MDSGLPTHWVYKNLDKNFLLGLLIYKLMMKLKHFKCGLNMVLLIDRRVLRRFKKKSKLATKSSLNSWFSSLSITTV